jgi:hypothetical protein
MTDRSKWWVVAVMAILTLWPAAYNPLAVILIAFAWEALAHVLDWDMRKRGI